MKDLIPIEEVLPGFKVYGIPEKWTSLDAIVLVKCYTKDGDTSWVFTKTENINEEELLGALVVQTDLLRQSLVESFRFDEMND